MSTELLPKAILEKYEVHEWRHACAILKDDFNNEWNDIINLLSDFRLRKSWIIASGGRKSKISDYMDNYLYKLGWREKNLTHQLILMERKLAHQHIK